MASDPPLSKEEQEEEEMRNELTAVGLFYETMDKQEMKNLIQMLNESREASKSNSSSFKATQDNAELLENSPGASTSSRYAGDPVDVGDLPSEFVSSEEQLNNNEKNLESSSRSYVKNIHNERTELKSFSEKNTNLNNDDYPALRSKSNYKSNIEDASKVKAKETKKPSAIVLKKRAAERWRLNPWQFAVEEIDTPLKRPDSFDLKEDEALPNNVEELDAEKFEELCRQMNEKLDSLREKIILDESFTERKSKWGSPIKATTKWNSSLDKNSVVEKPLRQTRHSPDRSLRDIHDRATKRKALSTIAAFTRDESNDDNSDDEFITTKRGKFQQEKKTEVTKKDQEIQKNKSTNQPLEMIEVDDIKNTEDFDNINLRSLRRNSNRNTLNSTEFNEKQTEYPRRIIPPNPSKKKFQGPRAKTKTATESQKNFIKKNGLDDEEITKTLNALNEQIDDNDDIQITDEIRPAPVSKYSKKLQEARFHLENVRNADEQKIKAEEEARQQMEKEERQKKDELIAKRWQEEENERQRKLDIERKSNEKTEIYNTRLNSQSRVTRSTFKTRQNHKTDAPLNGNDDNGDDDEPMEIHSNIVPQTPCPICQKPFSVNEIESHASECDQFSSESDKINIYQPSTSRTGMELYECFICNKFKTVDGNRFDDHIIKCKANAEDTRNGIYA